MYDDMSDLLELLAVPGIPPIWIEEFERNIAIYGKEEYFRQIEERKIKGLAETDRRNAKERSLSLLKKSGFGPSGTSTIL